MACAPPQPRPLHHHADGGVTAAAIPDQVRRFAVALIPGHVANFDVFSRAAERADGRARRPAAGGRGSVALRAIADFRDGLAPVTTALGRPF